MGQIKIEVLSMQKFVEFVQQVLGNVAAKTACPGVVGG